MGIVYLAVDTQLGREVALKVLPEYFSMDRDRLVRFRREARATSLLNHPNIVTVFEIGQMDSCEFIVTEYVEGRTLRDLMRRGPVPFIEVLKIGSQVAGALTAAHKAGIIHRDIKPENVMIRPDGYVKVLDFGLAKLSDSARKTGSGDI
jgi:serine/threonine protein kinase